jgi:hypothetical protein
LALSYQQRTQWRSWRSSPNSMSIHNSSLSYLGNLYLTMLLLLYYRSK